MEAAFSMPPTGAHMTTSLNDRQSAHHLVINTHTHWPSVLGLPLAIQTHRRNRAPCVPPTQPRTGLGFSRSLRSVLHGRTSFRIPRDWAWASSYGSPRPHPAAVICFPVSATWRAEGPWRAGCGRLSTGNGLTCHDSTPFPPGSSPTQSFSRVPTMPSVLSSIRPVDSV